jgi:hypothetical protein
MAPSPQIKQQAAHLFLQWYKESRSHFEAMQPFVGLFLQSLGPQIVMNLHQFKNAGQFGKIFEIMGTMLCDVSVPFESRFEYNNYYL